jgi:alpha-beta hydrolase superfamily lysophospholipase
LKLFYYLWNSGAQATSTVVIIHGLGEHSGRYIRMRKFFAQAGFQAVAFDLRGHDWSGGCPVSIKYYRELADDVETILYRFWNQQNFLFGHSLGGQLVLWMVQRLPLKISSAPWLALAFSPPKW